MISSFKSSAMVRGFVFGILKHDHTMDVERNTELVDLAASLLCTFHRAFDEIDDPIGALEAVVRCGFKTILTSGRAANAVQGCEVLAQLVSNARKRIMIMPDGGDSLNKHRDVGKPD